MNIKKKEFEEYLFNMNNGEALECRIKKERTGEIFFLYYGQFGHVGTWQKRGLCVIFEKIIYATNKDAFQLEGSRVIKQKGKLKNENQA
tara:strand:- start:1177 stop:1443 length:267 start_codon:yes stop_codon:yes gene_type:complete